MKKVFAPSSTCLPKASKNLTGISKPHNTKFLITLINLYKN